MTRIPFVYARFPDPQYGEVSLRHRLRTFATELHERNRVPDAMKKPDGTPEREAAEDVIDRFSLPHETVNRINRRARCLAQQHLTSRPIAQLKEADRRLIDRIKDGVDLVRIESEDHADRIAAALHEEFPWLAVATSEAWHAMRRSVRVGEPGFRMPPLVLDGPPGVGKSAWARFLCAQLKVPTVEIDASGEGAGWGMVGLQRGWGSAMPGRPISTIIEHRVGNPMIVIDEAEKPGVERNSKGQTFSLAGALLPLLEPLTARRWNCPYFQLPFDMSWISWVMTTNEQQLLPAPLRSRCTILAVPQVGLPDLVRFVRREQDRRDLSDAATEAVVSALKSAPRGSTPPSLRTALRLLTIAENLDSRPRLH